MARAQQAVQKTEDKDQAADAPERDSPLLDLSDQAVKRLLKTAKAKGYVTLDQLNSVLPSEEVSSDQIEDLYAMLSDMGITVVETEEGEEKEEGAEELAEDEEGRSLVAQNNALVKSETKSEPAERTDDPVRMYLR
ncbi:MAG: RNA polymerase sigma factor RpoD, partial [Proteobacteria bacterium]|nr:RNA polymerase sigma factor RpoD [Pseudomonadota bacterium]